MNYSRSFRTQQKLTYALARTGDGDAHMLSSASTPRLGEKRGRHFEDIPSSDRIEIDALRVNVNATWLRRRLEFDGGTARPRRDFPAVNSRDGTTGNKRIDNNLRGRVPQSTADLHNRANDDAPNAPL